MTSFHLSGNPCRLQLLLNTRHQDDLREGASERAAGHIADIAEVSQRGMVHGAAFRLRPLPSRVRESERHLQTGIEKTFQPISSGRNAHGPTKCGTPLGRLINFKFNFKFPSFEATIAK